MKINFIERTQEALRIHSFRRTQVPELVSKILRNDNWKFRDPAPKELKPREFQLFAEFVEAPRPWGLQTEYKELEFLCKGFEDVELALSKEKLMKGKEIKKEELKTTVRKTEKEQHLERLERERPDLLKKVLTKQISTHKAMIEAGFAKERVKVEKSPEGFANYISGHFNKKQKRKLLKLLKK